MATTKEEFISGLQSLAHKPLPMFAGLLEKRYKDKLHMCQLAWSFKHITPIVDVFVFSGVPGADGERAKLIEAIEHGKKSNKAFAAQIENVLCDILNDPDLSSEAEYLKLLEYLDDALDKHIFSAYEWSMVAMVHIKRLVS